MRGNERLVLLVIKVLIQCIMSTRLLQGVVEWASADPLERQKWLPVLIKNINLEFLKSQGSKWLSVLEEKNLLQEDLKNIVDPIRLKCCDEENDCENQKPQSRMGRNALEEVIICY